MKAAAVILWVLAWGFAGLIPASWFAARDGKRARARAMLAVGLAGTTWAAIGGTVLW